MFSLRIIKMKKLYYICNSCGKKAENLKDWIKVLEKNPKISFESMFKYYCRTCSILKD